MTNMLSTSIIILTIFLPAIKAYKFECLDECKCDTDEETIHCEGNPDRHSLHLPTTHLRGFTKMILKNNDIKHLPNEKTLIAKFPDLKTIDLSGNVNFHCDSTRKYSKLHMATDCGKKATDVRLPTHTSSSTTATSAENEPSNGGRCGRVKPKKAHEIDEFVRCLLDPIQEKLSKVGTASDGMLNELLESIGNMFSTIEQRLSHL